ncbi:MAG: cytochrome c-type biogenesis protein CcmH [Archangium sp.]|nr:cytochrome c-type biogenesis protein CcmH [Archangium sp.]MDP3152424.1 cytochrome c-type biogenesis protein CcmH [Archangium sp.]MDP3572406.1 cytochrome c-type biogenesis protein CcmH [Archangium sp.]
MIALVLSLVLAQGYAPLRQGQDPLDSVREQRVQAVGKKLRCAVCQGVSIADSPASMARAQLDKVRELVAEGKNDQEIFDYFVERYGEWALMEPKKSGITLGLWLAPVLVLVLGVLLIISSTKKPAAPVAAATEEPADDYLAKVRADLEK